jgi:hypothetical protein
MFLTQIMLVCIIALTRICWADLNPQILYVHHLPHQFALTKRAPIHSRVQMKEILNNLSLGMEAWGVIMPV